MRIGWPARKHGVSDQDVWHAVRYAVRLVAMDEDLTMIIGSAGDGAMVEIGVCSAWREMIRLPSMLCRSVPGSTDCSGDDHATQ